MSLSCTVRPTFVICFHWSLLLVFSLYFPSSSANVSKPYVLASTTQQSRTFVLSVLEIFLSAITAFTFLHAFAPVCIMRSTAQIHQLIYLLNVFPLSVSQPTPLLSYRGSTLGNIYSTPTVRLAILPDLQRSQDRLRT